MKSHYLLQEPGLGFPLVAIALNLLVIGALWQLTTIEQQRVHIAWGAMAVTGTSESAPRIEISGDGTIRLNGQAMPTMDDLQFRLSGLSANGNQLAVLYARQLPAQALSDVLRVCSLAGFTGISLQQIPR